MYPLLYLTFPIIGAMTGMVEECAPPTKSLPELTVSRGLFITAAPLPV